MAKLMPNGKQQFFDANGDPLASGKVYTYAAGTSTPKDTYTTYTGGTANANPVILDARGEATIFWDGAYKVVLKDSTDATIWTVDNITTLSSAADISYASSTIDVILKDHSCYVVDTIASLRAVDKTKYTHCFVQGYYAKGDGGGGMYWYDSSDTTTADDGGGTIVGTDGGRWKLMHNGSVDLRQFGAKPDHLTDCGSAITNACAYLGAKGGDIMIDGNFLLSSNITLTEGCILKGYNPTPTPRIDGAYNSTYYRSILAIDKTYKITGKRNSGFMGLLVLEKNVSDAGSYPMPFASDVESTAATSAFGGYGIYFDGSGMVGYTVEDCIIIGFNYPYYVFNATKSNGNINNLLSDCAYGVDLNSAVNSATDVYTNTTHVNVCVGPYSTWRSLGASLAHAATAAGEIGIRISGDGLPKTSVTGIGLLSYGFEKPIYAGAGATLVNCQGNKSSAGTYSIYVTSNAEILGGTVGNGGAYIDENALQYKIRDLDCETYTWQAGAGRGLIDGISGGGVTFAGDTTAKAKCIITNDLNAHTPTAWTPVLKHAGTERVTAYTTQVGQYTVHDNLVTAICNITVNTITGGAGGDAATITGLPFAAAAGIKGGGYATYTAGLVTVVDGITADIAAGSQIAALYQGSGTGSAVLTYADTVAGCTLNYVFQYFIDR